jgi:hypothetical protein
MGTVGYRNPEKILIFDKNPTPMVSFLPLGNVGL